MFRKRPSTERSANQVGRVAGLLEAGGRSELAVERFGQVPVGVAGQKNERQVRLPRA